MELNIWRAPTDNDRNIKNTWMRAQYDRTVTRAYETTAKEENGCVEIETSYSISSPALQRILAGVIKWTIYSDGTTDVHVEAKKDSIPGSAAFWPAPVPAGIVCKTDLLRPRPGGELRG